ncbi:MAG: hypothetical protein Q8K92_22605 [Leadbetterella sp.]|nr:hypothetical protein [Leadbetterella sp.]
MPQNTKLPASAAERKALERQKKRELGLVPKEIWIKPEHWQNIQNYIKNLHKNS